MTSRIVGNFHSELPMVSRRLIEALGATGLVPLEEYFGQKAAVVAAGPGRRALLPAPDPRLLVRGPDLRLRCQPDPLKAGGVRWART